MKIGIMGAMPEEVNILLTHMSDITHIELGARSYHIGKINNHDIVLVFSRWGKVAASATVTTLITKFNIEQLIFTGVAGAANSSLNIGDVVICEKLYQHDMDARPLMPRYQIPLTNLTYFSCDELLVNKAVKSVNKLFAEFNKNIPMSSLADFNITEPKYMLGLIATGDQFIHDVRHTVAITKEHPDTLAIEMEGAAVAQVCTDYKIPFIVIRTISDKANHATPLDFPRFINEVARHYSEQIILDMLNL